MKRCLGVLLGMGLAASAAAKPFYIRTWLLCGPFEGATLETAVLPNEAQLNPRARDKAGALVWTMFPTTGDMVDLASPAAVPYRNNAIAYAFVRVKSLTAQRVWLSIGSDDGARLWVNGVEVLCRPMARGHVFGDDRVAVDLEAGTNRILFKIENYFGGWSFSCGLTDGQNKAPVGLSFDPAPLVLDRLPIRRVEASSYQGNQSLFRPRNAVDGDPTTRWSSEHVDPQFFTLDFGSVQPVSACSIRWENAHAEKFHVDASLDKENWTTIHQENKSRGGETVVVLSAPVEARYVRLVCQKRATAWGYSVWEFAALGTPRGAAIKGAPEEAVVSPSLRVKSVDASSMDGSSRPEDAVDGNPATRWSSRHRHDPEWLLLDLGKATPVGRIQLLWEGAYASSYLIETSLDKVHWTTGFRTDAGDGKWDSVLLEKSVMARYVRITGLARATDWGYSLWEVQLFPD